MEELQDDDPRQIGRYVLLGRIGSGGMGEVFLGRSPGGRLVAVKVIHAMLAKDRNFRIRFAREVAAARRVGGVYTAPVIDADPDARLPWLATAYVNGPSLAGAVTEDGPLPLPAVLDLAAGLAEGIGAIHEAGVIHRDLKPSNVLLAPDGPRLIDFGISQAADFSHLTLTGIVIGTPGFMSPEQALGEPIGPPSDIFSLGAILTFAATGEGPYGSGTPTVRQFRLVSQPPRLDGVPAELRPIVERCMAREPAERPTANVLLAEIIAARQDAPGHQGFAPGMEPLAGPAHLATATATPTPPSEPETGQDQLPPTVPGPATPVPPVPVPPGPQVSADKAARPARRRRRRAIAGAVGFVAVASAIAGLVVALPRAGGRHAAIGGPSAAPTPVLAAAGLAGRELSPTSVELTWSAPAGGAAPDHYEIEANGRKIALVAAAAPAYRVTGLVAGTRYRFSVIAVRGTERSAPSAALDVTPASLPLSAAVLSWDGYVRYTTLSRPPAIDQYQGQGIPDTMDQRWTFRPDCATGPCDATLHGTAENDPFIMHLTRTGATYAGSVPIDKWWYCGADQTNYLKTTLFVTVKVAKAVWQAGQWTVSSFAGDSTWQIYYHAAGNCFVGAYKFGLRSK